jgi:hypothetical protein
LHGRFASKKPEVYLPIVIAGFVALVGLLQLCTAVVQWKTAHNRATFDLFEKRLEIYRVFREAVGRLVASRSDASAYLKAASALEGATFLFGADLREYLERLVNDIGYLQDLVRERDGLTAPQDLKKSFQQERFYADRIERFRIEGVALFAKYIRFDQKPRRPSI